MIGIIDLILVGLRLLRLDPMVLTFFTSLWIKFKLFKIGSGQPRVGKRVMQTTVFVP